MPDYPFDGAKLMRKRRAMVGELRKKDGLVPKKIAIIGGSTIDRIADLLELFLLDFGIAPEIYRGGYGRYYEEAVFDNDGLREFAPDFIYIHTTCRNILKLPEITDSDETAEQLIREQYLHMEQVWEQLAKSCGCVIIQNNFDPPPCRLQGNRDATDKRGGVYFTNRLNLMLADYASAHESFFVNDIAYLAARCGLDCWSSPAEWYLYKQTPAAAAIPELCHSVACIIKSVLGRNKKVLMLDLDNTLWGGVVGDDGVQELELGSETPMGQAYLEFQSYIKQLGRMGVLLTVNSKNDYENAIAGLNHPSGVLKPEDFAVIKANWCNKDKNSLETAQELNLMTDSMVFFDDNPVERGLVSALDAGIAVPQPDAPEDYLRLLDRNGFFEVTGLSGDDLNRADMYRRNLQRDRLKAQTGDYDEYLRSLEMQAEIRPFEPVYLPRIAQLTNKSNQFNLTTLRCTAAELERISKDTNWLTLYGRLSDRFGDNGVVAVTMGEQQGDTLDITLWLMSCRVLKRGMEYAMLDKLAQLAAQRGIKKLRGHYYPTAKNAMVKDFYTELGFELLERDETGSGLWELPLEGYKPRNGIIAIKESVQ